MIGAGFAMSAFAAMQSALVLLNAPEASRRRMMGVLSVCIGTGPIGFMHLGLLADLVGTATACSIVAIEGLLVLVIVVRKWPVLLSPQPSDL